MRTVCLITWVILGLSQGWTLATEIFSTNSTWRFRRGLSEASSPVGAWRAVEFNDAAAGFADAAAPFWYGDVRVGGTQLTDMQNRYSCIFLRRPFQIGNAAQVVSMRLRAYVDDGFVAWINGVEVARTNVADAEPTYQTLAANAAEPVPLVTYTLPAPAGYLRSGTNVLVVQAFNTTLGSSDFGFDALLDVTIFETTPPVIVGVRPPPGTVSELTEIAVTFSEPVIGLTADDFLIDGVPISTLSVSGNTYIFRFAQPPYGPVYINWISGHGITDLATPPNAFDAGAPGASWQYNLVDAVPPVVAALHPPAGLTLRTLAQVEVTFSEAVTGVDAQDLLVNGAPATGLTPLGGYAYRFSFPPPANGLVTLSWAPGHGITDTATTPNAFGGGSWNYTVDPNARGGDLVINEFLASNVRTNGLADEDGEQQDWIEIYNRGVDPVNLENWSLSDDPALPGLWTFPARILEPNSYLVVFASGKDRRSTNTTSVLHTNFRLGTPGEHLGLYSPDAPRVLVDGFDPYPEQRNDISYGRDGTNGLRYFATPTPGAPNGVSTIVGVCAPVHANVSRGHFSRPFDLVLSCATPGAELRYTTDGSEPTASSPLFPGTVRISGTTLFRAAAFKPNHLPSQTITHSYLFNLPAALRSLPVLSIVTATNHLYGSSGILGIQGGTYSSGPWQPVAPGDYHNPSKHGMAWERPVSVEWIRPEDNSGFQVDCGIRVHGSDYQRPRLTPSSKFSFRLYFRNDYGPGRLKYPLFPLTTVQDFDQLVLRAGFNEQGNPFIRDELHRRLSHDMGQIASHGNLAVVFVNGTYYASSPWYNPCERVHEEFFQSHLGGGEEWDVVRPPWSEGGGAVDGTFTDFQNLVNFINSSTMTLQSVYSYVSRRLDLTNFVDYCLLNTYAGMGDWPQNNWRAGREISTNGIWRFVVWDAEWGMGIYGRSPLTINSFTLSSDGDPNSSGLANSSEIARMFQKLRTSPEFRLLWADRVHKHFFNGGVLTGAHITNRFNELRNELSALIPNMDVGILNWVRDRQPVFFNQMNALGLMASSNAPGFNQFGGRVPTGFALVMTNLSGTIYYTTNGTDPRVPFSGAVSPSAVAYTGPVPLTASVGIRARSLSGANWSAVTEAVFTVGSLGIPLRITEIMYNPPGGSLYEFLELQNIGATPVDLSGMYFDGITFLFNAGSILPGGARLVLANNTDTNAWKALYPGVPVFGWYSGNLNNGGERITLYDGFGRIITSVDYRDSGGWPTAADGGGSSLEILDPNGNPDEPANWQASTVPNGTPGTANSAPPVQGVQLNEIMAANGGVVNHGGTFPDWVELRNLSASPVNLAGWSLTDDGNPRKYVFPFITIPANGYLVAWCDAATNTTPGLHTGFSLDREGETLSLFDPNTNRIDALTYGFQLTNYSVGRVGGKWVLTQPTANAANVAATVVSAANLALNEWMANPLPGEPDWIELFNRSAAAPVSLQGIYLSTSNGLHQLTSLSFLPPSGHIQLFADEGVGADHLDFKLPASGGAITLSDPTGNPIQTVLYGVQSEGVSQGRLPDGSTQVTTFPGTASPGAPNYVSSYSGPVLNEVLARNKSVSVGGKVVDYLELYNPNAGSFDLSGMSLSVNSLRPGQWVFPAGALIAGYGYLVVQCDGASPASTQVGGFNLGQSLDGESGGAWLFNAAGQVVSSVEYGLQAEDLPIGLTGGQWRLLSAATPGAANAGPAVLGLVSALRLNEWMPMPVSGADWFEVFNTTNRPVSLATLSLTDDPSIAGESKFRPAALSFIGPNGFVKWVADADPGQGRNHVNFALDSNGESLLLYSVSGTTFNLVDGVGFGALPEGVSHGRLPDGAVTVTDFPGSPTPGESNYRLLQNVVFSEALAHTDPPLEDAIELYNPTAAPLNIGGWFLSNSRTDRRKYQIPPGTTLPAGGYCVFYEYQFNNGTTNAFALNSAHGDEIWLSAAVGGVETGERAFAAFGASFNGISFGRVETSTGWDFAPLAYPTFGVANPSSLAHFRTGQGAPNAAPIVGPVVINEIFYHPPDGDVGSREFIELRNLTTVSVPLFDPVYPTNRWRLAGGVDYTFPPGLILPAGGYLLVVDFDPSDSVALAAFRARYAVDPGVPVLGPFSGKLANEGEELVLERPDRPQQPPNPDAGFVPYVVADRVLYSDAAPWPAGLADGGGHSLQRLSGDLYGNEPLHWTAAPPTPGGENRFAPLDSDGDGIPDAAEEAMGLNPSDPRDAGEDWDGDGATNLQEYLAGTNHLDPASHLKFDRIALGTEVQLWFQAVSNRTYSVLYKNSLSDPDWARLVDVPALAVTTTRSVTDPEGGRTVRFYRLVTPAVPPR